MRGQERHGLEVFAEGRDTQGEHVEPVVGVLAEAALLHYGRMGLLDGLPATNRKEPDRIEASGLGS